MELDTKDLKTQALLERISSLTAYYENQDADRRVEITLLRKRNDELVNAISELQTPQVTENVEEESN